MRRIIVAAFISLDGVIQAPGGPEEDPTGGFAHGGWVTQFWDEGLNDAMDAQFARPFDLLLGRRTYDIFAAHWPFIDTDPGSSSFDALNHEIATTFNRITKFVATHRPEGLSWANSIGLGDDVPARLAALKKEDGPDLLTQGSSELVHLLFGHDLVDEVRLLMMPVVLGCGKRLFDHRARPRTLRLESAATTEKGVQLLVYSRGGDVATGSFGLETPTAAELERRRTLEG